MNDTAFFSGGRPSLAGLLGALALLTSAVFLIAITIWENEKAMNNPLSAREMKCAVLVAIAADYDKPTDPVMRVPGLMIPADATCDAELEAAGIPTRRWQDMGARLQARGVRSASDNGTIAEVFVDIWCGETICGPSEEITLQLEKDVWKITDRKAAVTGDKIHQ